MRTDKRGSPLPSGDAWRMYRWALMQAAELLRQAVSAGTGPSETIATLERLAGEAARYEGEARRRGPKAKNAQANPLSALGEPAKKRGRPRGPALIGDAELLLAIEDGRRFFGHRTDADVIRTIVDRHLAASTSLRRQGLTRDKLVRALKRQSSEARRRIRKMAESQPNSD